MNESPDDTISTTDDTMWRGTLPLRQPAKGQGYRFNFDSVLLAGVIPTGFERGLELGLGCGVISIMLLKWRKVSAVLGCERQQSLAELARYNAENNHCLALNPQSKGLWIAHEDLRRFQRSTEILYDLVYLNPPFYKDGSGLAAHSEGRDAARYERHGGLDDFIGCACQNLSPEGRVFAILPDSRRSECAELFGRRGLGTRSLVLKPHETRAPHRVVVAASKMWTGHSCTGPVIVHGADGRYLQPFQSWVDGQAIALENDIFDV